MVDHALLEEARALQDDAVALRRRLHRRPELGLHLPRTQEAVLEALDGLPLTVRTGQATSSVVATLDGAHPGRTVLLRADMDALPMPEDTGLVFASEVDGAMHACGHDAHTAMLVTAARLLADRRDALHGRVVFMFQPGEEGHHGARVMLDEGLLAVGAADEPPSLAFAIHVTPTIPPGLVSTKPGPLLAATDELLVRVRGRGGHASMPHLATDPVPVACEIVQAWQTMVTRTVDVFDPAVVTVGSIRAGTTTNVIPEHADLVGTVRTVSERTRQGVLERIQRVARGVAGAHGCDAEVALEPGYPVTVNDDVATGAVVDVARDLVGPERVLIQPAPVMGAEDFSYILQEVPGAMVFLGMRPDGPGPVAPNHSNRMVIDEAPMADGAALHAAVALAHLT